jgi:hypothetical protein
MATPQRAEAAHLRKRRIVTMNPTFIPKGPKASLANCEQEAPPLCTRWAQLNPLCGEMYR